MLGTNMQNDSAKGVWKALSLLLLILSVFFVIKIVNQLGGKDSSGMREFRTITVSGHGEIQAVPDIAKVHFTISKIAPTAKEAQEAVNEIEKGVLASLKENGVEDRDIKTTDSSFYPQYEYRYDAPRILCNGYGCPPNGRNVIVGYEVSESIEAKVRDTDSVGKIIQDLGALGVSSLSGPNFSIDDEDALKIDARKLAIEEAKAEAEMLARDLGVRLGKISNFSESEGYYPMPYMSKGMALDMAVAESAPANLPVGENTISSDVSITYEIK